MTHNKANRFNGRPHWNYQPCWARLGTVIVGKSPCSTWWCAAMEGQRIDCVQVQQAGHIFFLDDRDCSGTIKVFSRGGGPDSHHRSIPVDDPDSFEQTKFNRAPWLRAYWKGHRT